MRVACALRPPRTIVWATRLRAPVIAALSLDIKAVPSVHTWVIVGAPLDVTTEHNVDYDNVVVDRARPLRPSVRRLAESSAVESSPTVTTDRDRQTDRQTNRKYALVLSLYNVVDTQRHDIVRVSLANRGDHDSPYLMDCMRVSVTLMYCG